MALFQYRALRTDGTIDEGRFEARDRPEALNHLRLHSLDPVSLDETAEASGRGRSLPRRGRVGFRALETFTRQLSSLLAAGIPLSRGLKILGREAASPAAATRWHEIHGRVVDGMALADAMAQCPGTFPKVYVAMVRAGETGGFLDLVLAQVAEFMQTEKDLRSRVVTALIYPAVLFTLAIAVLIFLLTFFIPRFQAIFADLGGQLPLLTRAIVATSATCSRYGVFIALAGVGGAVLLYKWLKTENGRRRMDQIVLRTPILGALQARFAMTRFCRMLGTLVGAGVPLIAALRVARESIGNQTLADAITEATARVRQGDSLTAGLACCEDLFPPSILEIIAVAEETGRLDQELVRVAATAEGDLERQLHTAVALAEPLMLFLMAAFIGTIFVGMVIPIFTIQEYIK